jgi:hypothetical protein
MRQILANFLLRCRLSQFTPPSIAPGYNEKNVLDSANVDTKKVQLFVARLGGDDDL